MRRSRIETTENDWILRFNTISTIDRPTTHDYYRPLKDDEIRRRRHNQNSDYQWWIAHYDTLSVDEMDQIRQFLATLVDPPTVTYLTVATDDTTPTGLRRSMGSLIAQLYGKWRSIIIDNNVTDSHLKVTLDDYRKRDPRIRVLTLDDKLAYSDALNKGLEEVSTDYVGTMRPGDLLRSHTLAWFAHELTNQPHVAIAYSDHDLIDDDDRRHDHHFKSDWNPELALCQDYTGRGVLFDTILAKVHGGFHPDLTLHPEWELILRLSENVNAAQIRHCPTILYHQHASELAGSPPCHLNQLHQRETLTIVTETLDRRGQPYTLTWASNSSDLIPTFQVVGDPKVSIIIPTRNGLEDLSACINSLQVTTYSNYEVIIVNNASDEPETLAYLDQLDKRTNYRVIDYPHAFNYADLHNTVVAQLETDYLCLLNNDTEVLNPNWLTDLLGYAQPAEVGAVGAKLLYPDTTIQHAGVTIGVGGLASHAHRDLPADALGYHGRANLPQAISAVTAACLLIKATHWAELRGMAEELPIAFNDVDFCLRLQEAGYHNVFVPQATLIHHESKSRGKDSRLSQQRRATREHGYMQWRWGPQLNNDPCYNPNLTLDSEDFTLTPPRHLPPWSSRLNWLILPDGLNHGHSQRLPLATDSILRVTCTLPITFDGTIYALQIYLGASAGTLDGTLNVTLTCDQSTIQKHESLAGHRGEFPFTIDLANTPFTPRPGSRLRLETSPIGTTTPVNIVTFQTTNPWDHHIIGLPDTALQVRIGYR